MNTRLGGFPVQLLIVVNVAAGEILPILRSDTGNTPCVLPPQDIAVERYKTGNYEHNRKLQFVMVNVVPNDECSQRLRAMTRPAEILDTHICAIGRNVSKTCQEDGGAPMIAFNRNGQYVQHGSLSFGPDGCGSADAPDVFTRIESYIPWILDHLEE
uniref:Peptidase S1 domain-containing protein n=1 Tax=Anopheles farauti TaxID=69004 RepID=A0A182QUA3_9DIPT